jgi:hypothetical protein
VSGSQPRLIALAAGGAVATLVIIGGFYALVRWLSGDSREAHPAPLSPAAELASAGMNAPGTNELRQLGCDPAVVLDMARLLGDAAAINPGEPGYVVTCVVGAAPSAPAPTCEQAAGIYFAALGGSAGGNVSVRVMRAGATAPACARLYAPSGADLGR